jgi:hypothetical protein
MFRYLPVILLLLAFSAQTFNLGWLVLSYSTNKTAYQRNCENRQVSGSHCKGKCQFYKKLKSEQEKEQQFPESRSGYKIDVAFYRSDLIVPRYVVTEIHSLKYSPYILSFPNPAAIDIFHPPV